MSTSVTLPIFGTTVTTWDPSDTSCVQSQVASKFDPAWCDSALNLPNSSSIGTSPTFTAAPTFWFHYELQTTSFNGPSNDLVWQMLNGATVVADCHVSGTAVAYAYTFRTLQSGTLTAVGTSVVVSASALNRFDVGLVGNTGSGSLTVASFGTQVFSVTGLNHSGFTGVTQMKISAGNAPFENSWWSQTILDTTSTIGRNVKTVRQDTLSATNTSWVATLAEISKPVNSDSTFCSSPTAAQNFSAYQSTLNLAGFTILAIGAGLRIKREDSSGPQNAKLLIRSNGTNYNSGTISTVGLGYQAAFNSWTSDPNTSSSWTAAHADTAETGGTSVT